MARIWTAISATIFSLLSSAAMQAQSPVVPAAPPRTVICTNMRYPAGVGVMTYQAFNKVIGGKLVRTGGSFSVGSSSTLLRQGDVLGPRSANSGQMVLVIEYKGAKDIGTPPTFRFNGYLIEAARSVGDPIEARLYDGDRLIDTRKAVFNSDTASRLDYHADFPVAPGLSVFTKSTRIDIYSRGRFIVSYSFQPVDAPYKDTLRDQIALYMDKAYDVAKPSSPSNPKGCNLLPLPRKPTGY